MFDDSLHGQFLSINENTQAFLGAPEDLKDRSFELKIAENTKKTVLKQKLTKKAEEGGLISIECLLFPSPV